MLSRGMAGWIQERAAERDNIMLRDTLDQPHDHLRLHSSKFLIIHITVITFFTIMLAFRLCVLWGIWMSETSNDHVVDLECLWALYYPFLPLFLSWVDEAIGEAEHYQLCDAGLVIDIFHPCPYQSIEALQAPEHPSVFARIEAALPEQTSQRLLSKKSLQSSRRELNGQ